MSVLTRISALAALGKDGSAILKAAAEAAKKAQEFITDLDADKAALKQQIAKLSEEIVVAKQAYMALYEALLELQQKEKEAQRFQAEAKRYAMTRTEQGSIVYTLRPECAGSEPPHDLCAACFQQEVKSVLQPTAHNTLTCPVCHGTFYKPDGQDIGIRVAPVRHGRFDRFP